MPYQPTPQQRADEHRIDDGIDAAYLTEQHDPVERQLLKAVGLLLQASERHLRQGFRDEALADIRGARLYHGRLWSMNQDEDRTHQRMRARNRDEGYAYVQRRLAAD